MAVNRHEPREDRMERDNKTVCMGFHGLAGPAARVLERLIAGGRNAGALLAAAREIGYAADRPHVTHAALRQAADRIYRKHGIATAPPWRDDGTGSTVPPEGEAGVEGCLVNGAGRTASRRGAAGPPDQRSSPGRRGY